MSRVPLGKVLLRNVIRHTDAHNKIQEESDMWKIRELEKQMEDAYRGTKRKMLPSSSSRMRSDGFDEETQRDYWRPKSEISGALEDNFLKAKSWNKKLYDYEADMPDRWGHSGYKELYPEEFETDSDQQDITNGKKTSPQVKSSTHESHKHKKSKKSHKKKQKKKSHKKQKKSKKEAIDIMADSSSEFSEETGASSTRKQPHKRKKKSRKKSLKKSALVLEAESDTSQSGDSASSSSEKSEERDTKKTKRKKRDKKIHIPVVNNEIQERTNKRTNWKVATDERSAESSEDD
ncbi:NKAP domain containing 1 [Rhinolophus ferrumequinum]|uniref:NKAP domain containing 1 n=1 Tax=Rhinolophus ferrumequinum TaxID=59479 RepID=A0A7J7W8G4_RHIFE|nr:NKAP domain containing 1 [Rhinolophus ferrumequinum]